MMKAPEQHDDVVNSMLGKQLLATLRGGDYAHPGEKEAIELALQGWPRDPALKILDAGCGRGGTSWAVQQGGWGTVVGVDRDAESIRDNAERYPGIKFLVQDLTALPKDPAALGGPFDGIVMFNVLYAMAPQKQVLQQLSALARPGARLMVFDYTGSLTPQQVAATSIWHPLPGGQQATGLPEQQLLPLLEGTGWELQHCQDITEQYIGWYKHLCARIQQLRDEQGGSGEPYPEPLLARFASNYGTMLQLLQQGHLGGIIIHAEAAAG